MLRDFICWMLSLSIHCFLCCPSLLFWSVFWECHLYPGVYYPTNCFGLKGAHRCRRLVCPCAGAWPPAIIFLRDFALPHFLSSALRQYRYVLFLIHLAEQWAQWGDEHMICHYASPAGNLLAWSGEISVSTSAFQLSPFKASRTIKARLEVSCSSSPFWRDCSLLPLICGALLNGDALGHYVPLKWTFVGESRAHVHVGEFLADKFFLAS